MSDLVLPAIGLGTYQLHGKRGYEAARYALESGYRHLDTATSYHNEAEVGRAVKDSGVPREDVFITTKLPPGKAGQVRRTLDESLKALGTEYVDLWLIHWPPGGRAAPDTWREMLELRDAGLARAVGVSNYGVALVDELIAATGEAPAVNQVPWGPTLHRPARLAAYRERGIVVEGYSPLNNTDLSAPALVEIGAAHAVTPAQVVLRWHIQHEIVAIPRSANPDRIRENLDVFDFELSPDEMARIDALGR
jgi:diketogulonate reductase-like aldo/keto reductase